MQTDVSLAACWEKMLQNVTSQALYVDEEKMHVSDEREIMPSLRRGHMMVQCQNLEMIIVVTKLQRLW